MISKYFLHLGNKKLANHISFCRRLKHNFNVADKNIKLVKLFHYYGFKENGFKEQGRHEICRSIFSCIIITYSVKCILYGFTATCQMGVV